jgi:hypothetical protein
MRDWKEEHMKMVLDGEGAYRIGNSIALCALHIARHVKNT